MRWRLAAILMLICFTGPIRAQQNDADRLPESEMRQLLARHYAELMEFHFRYRDIVMQDHDPEYADRQPDRKNNRRKADPNRTNGSRNPQLYYIEYPEAARMPATVSGYPVQWVNVRDVQRLAKRKKPVSVVGTTPLRRDEKDGYYTTVRQYEVYKRKNYYEQVVRETAVYLLEYDEMNQTLRFIPYGNSF